MFKAPASLFLLLIFSVTAWSQTGTSGKHKTTWATGTWEGTGYQIDDNSTWTMRLSARSGKFTIAYPSLNCGGVWVLRRLSSHRAVFRERLSYGQDKCENNGLVVIERLSRKQLVFLYRNPGEKQVSSSAVLNRATANNPLPQPATSQ